MGRYSERASVFFTRFTYHLGRKQRPAIGPPSAPQTSLNAGPRDTSLYRMLIHYIPSSQFSNSRTNLIFPFFLTSPQTRGSPVIMHGSGLCGIGESMITIGS